MIRAKQTILHDDISYKKGVIIEGLNKEEEKRLVDLKSAEYVISPEDEIKKQQVENVVTIPQEQFEELSKDLDELYNADDLKRAALEVGVDLTGITKKADIIAAIINQNKADDLLEDDINE